jgi:hypothetical protein
MTFLAVVVGWVFFRATSYGVAIDVLQGMFFGTHVGAIEASPLGINRIMAIDECAFWLGATSAVAFFMPNAYQLIGFGLRYAEEERLGGVVGGLFFGGVLSLIFLLLAISETRGVSEFLYFNF